MKILISLFFVFFSLNSFAVTFPANQTVSGVSRTRTSYTSSLTTNCSAVQAYPGTLTPWTGGALTICGGFTPVSSYARSIGSTGSYTFYQRLNYSCPANSTVSGSSCSSVAGYNSVYSGTYNQTTQTYSGGLWSVKATGSECTSPNVYNSVTGVCDIPAPPPQTNLVAASLLGLTGLVGVGLGIVAFSPIGISLGLATTVTAGLLALSSLGSSDTTTAEKASNVYSPIAVELDPNKSLVSPAVNDGSAPKINKSPAKVLQPVGGDAKNVWSTAAGGKKTLTQTGSTGSRVVGEIEADGKTAVIYGSETKPVNTHIQVETDGSALVAHGGLVSSRNGSTGAATKVAVIEVHNFNSTGEKVATTQYTNNANQDGSSVDHVTVGSGSGGDGSANSCGSVNCEATQQIIKNTLVGIKTDLASDADTNGLQAGMPDGNVNPNTLQASMMENAPSAVKNFGSFAVVEHTSVCPVLTVPFNGQQYTMNTHCTLADDFRPQMIALMNFVWGFIAFMIVLGA